MSSVGEDFAPQHATSSMAIGKIRAQVISLANWRSRGSQGAVRLLMSAILELTEKFIACLGQPGFSIEILLQGRAKHGSI